jgi:hypothetical protein
MKPEDRSRIEELIGDLEKLRSRSPEESKFKDWKEKSEKKLEELFGRGSEAAGRFKSLRFFDFARRTGIQREAPLREEERTQFLRSLDEAKRLLRKLADT